MLLLCETSAFALKSPARRGKGMCGDTPTSYPLLPFGWPPRKKENVISCACPFAYFCFSSLFRDVDERRPE
jgi:hypothetical protein